MIEHLADHVRLRGGGEWLLQKRDVTHFRHHHVGYQQIERAACCEETEPRRTVKTAGAFI